MAFLIVAESLAVLLMCGLSQRMGFVSIRLRFYVSGFRINRAGDKLCIILLKAGERNMQTLVDALLVNPDVNLAAKW